jgi:glycerol-3-phosphate dehydrogenase
LSVLIVIHYISNDNKVMQRGSFPLRGKTREQVAFEWLRQIKREMPYYEKLEKVLADGEDITDLIKNLENTNIN